MKNILNVMKLLLFILFSFLVLFLFYLLSCETYTSLFFLDCSFENNISYILEEKYLYHFKVNPNNSYEDTPSSNNCINLNSVINIKNGISIMFNGLKNDTRVAMRKIKVFDRTLS
jgi:hypothetical protein